MGGQKKHLIVKWDMLRKKDKKMNLLLIDIAYEIHFYKFKTQI